MGIDLMGPFPKSVKQNEYLLIVDYCSKWVMFPLQSAKTPQIVRILVEEIFTRWGTPAYLVSDRGAQFTSQLLGLVCKQQQELMTLVKDNVRRAQAKQKRYYDQHRKEEHFKEGDVAWVRTHPLSRADEGFMAKLSAKWKGPAKIKKVGAC
ncbi:uncharacterized protein ftr06 isoform X1 [Tachysurus ichikawai]